MAASLVVRLVAPLASKSVDWKAEKKVDQMGENWVVHLVAQWDSKSVERRVDSMAVLLEYQKAE